MAKKKQKKQGGTENKESRKSKKSQKDLRSIKGFSMRFLPFSEIRNLSSDERIKKVLNICLKNNIIILQGRLKPEEESRLIGDTMAMIGHVQDFKGIELAVVSENNKKGFWEKMRKRMVGMLSGGDLGAVTIIGPATIVKEIKRDPKKIELMLNR